MQAQQAQPLTTMPQIVVITELERAINFWRAQFPSSRDTMTLCPQASCLAEVYARMIIFQLHEIPMTEFSTKAQKALRGALRGALQETKPQ